MQYRCQSELGSVVLTHASSLEVGGSVLHHAVVALKEKKQSPLHVIGIWKSVYWSQKSVSSLSLDVPTSLTPKRAAPALNSRIDMPI